MKHTQIAAGLLIGFAVAGGALSLNAQALAQHSDGQIFQMMAAPEGTTAEANAPGQMCKPDKPHYSPEKMKRRCGKKRHAHDCGCAGFNTPATAK